MSLLFYDYDLWYLSVDLFLRAGCTAICIAFHFACSISLAICFMIMICVIVAVSVVYL
jgi:hypothetical protein